MAMLVFEQNLHGIHARDQAHVVQPHREVRESERNRSNGGDATGRNERKKRMQLTLKQMSIGRECSLSIVDVGDVYVAS